MKTLSTAAMLLISLALQTHALDIKLLGYVLEIRAAQDVYLARGSLDHLKDATIAMVGVHGVTELELRFLEEYQIDSRPHTKRSREYRIQKVGGEGDGYYRVYTPDAPLPAVATAEILEEAIQQFLDKTEPRYMTPNKKGEQEAVLDDTQIGPTKGDQERFRKRPFILVGIDKEKRAVIDGVSFSDAQFCVLLTQLKKHEPHLVLRLRAPRDLLFSASRRLIGLAARSGVPASPSQPTGGPESIRKSGEKQ